MNRRRLTEMAFLLPWLGAFLLLPPAVLIVQAWSRAAGMPLFIIYIFVCWVLLIVLGGILSTRLGRLEDMSPESGGRVIERRDEAG